MPGRILVLTAWLGVSVACRGAPDGLAGPAGASPAHRPAAAASAAVRTAVDLLDDPFVRELMQGTGISFTALASAVRDATLYGGQEQMQALARVIAETRSRLLATTEDSDGGANEAILRATLVVVLEDAARWLERDAPVSSDEDNTGLREPGQY